eukprot:Ihof_evm2s358 gene=Ihof_evmTU2s358
MEGGLTSFARHTGDVEEVCRGRGGVRDESTPSLGRFSRFFSIASMPLLRSDPSPIIARHTLEKELTENVFQGDLSHSHSEAPLTTVSTPSTDRGSAGSEILRRESGSSSFAKYFPPSMPRRTLNMVLHRLKLIDRRQKPSDDDDLQQFWMPDDHCQVCYNCQTSFTLFRRRHHCRICGQVFCRQCCYKTVPGQLFGRNNPLLVCSYCVNVIEDYQEQKKRDQSEENADDMPRLSRLNTDQPTTPLPHPVLTKSSSNLLVSIESQLNTPNSGAKVIDKSISRSIYKNTSPVSGVEMDSFDMAHNPPIKAEVIHLNPITLSEPQAIKSHRSISSAQSNPTSQPHSAIGSRVIGPLVHIVDQALAEDSKFELKDHRHRLKNYTDCFSAPDLIDWLLHSNMATTREEGVHVGQLLLDTHLLIPVTDNETVFHDEYCLFTFCNTTLKQLKQNHNLIASPPLPSIIVSDKESDICSSPPPNGLPTSTNDVFPAILIGSPSSGMETPISDQISLLPTQIKPTNEMKDSRENDLDAIYSFRRSRGIHSDVGEPVLSDQSERLLFTPGPTYGGRTRPKASMFRSQPGSITDAHLIPLTNEMPRRRSNHRRAVSDGPPISCMNSELPKGGLIDKPANNHQGDNDLRHEAIALPNRRLSQPQSIIENKELTDDTAPETHTRILVAEGRARMQELCKQLLSTHGVDLAWMDVIISMTQKVCEHVRPNVRNKEPMDIRHYVKIKKIPGGSIADSQYVQGIAFTKTLANKYMRDTVHYPHVLLIRFAVEYQRVHGQFSSLDALVLQEGPYLRLVVDKLRSLRPDVILAQNTVSRLAQVYLQEAGISLVMNVKPSVIARVSRCTGADILDTMDSVEPIHTGQCEAFYVQTYDMPVPNRPHKSLMCLSGCPANLGGTIILRGGDLPTLHKVKYILQTMVYIGHAISLEIHFLSNENATLPYERRSGTATPSNEPSILRSMTAKELMKVKPYELFRAALKEIVLSTSPHVHFSPPFLYTDR